MALIRQYGLLDPDEFAIVWDDLGGIMSLAFDKIADQAHAEFGPCVRLSFPINGWLGDNEPAHLIGLVLKLRETPDWLHRVSGPSWACRAPRRSPRLAGRSGHLS